MGRPREHDLDTLLDHARRLWVSNGTSGLTIRALSGASGVSNGAIYNAFGSRDSLLARVWTREAERFLAFQRATVTDVLEGGGEVREAVVALALAPAEYSVQDEGGARLLLAVTSDDLADADVSEDQRRDLRRLRQVLNDLFVDLSRGLWNRSDTAALTVIRHCVVDLPSALLLRPDKLTDPLAQHTLVLAVRGVLAAEPPLAAASGSAEPGRFVDGLP